MNLSHSRPPLRILDESNFDSEVLQSSNDFLVIFWTSWSKPCQILDPLLEEIAQSCAGKTEVVKVNADHNPGLSLWFGVQHIPTLVHFRAGKMAGHLVGTVSIEAIHGLLRKDDQGTGGTAAQEEGASK